MMATEENLMPVSQGFIGDTRQIIENDHKLAFAAKYMMYMPTEEELRCEIEQ